MQKDQVETEGCQVGRQDHLGNRRQAEEAQPQRARQGDRDGRHDKPEPLTKPEARTEEEVVRRNFRITNRILENMVTRQDALVARRRSPAGPEAGENTQMHAVTGLRTRCLRTQTRKGGPRNATRGGQQARQQAAHRLPQKSRTQLEGTKNKKRPMMMSS